MILETVQRDFKGVNYMLEPIIKAQPLISKKEDYIKDQSNIAEGLSDQLHISKVAVWKYKDYKYYKGRGWTKSSISKPDPDEKFKDRVSPCFRKLLDIVKTCKHVGDLSILREYITDMAKEGIHITIDPDNLNFVDQSTFQEGIDDMCDIQANICATADAVRDMGPEAENINLCKSTRFKRLAEEYYKLNSNRSDEKKEKTRDNLKDEYAANLLNNKGISVVAFEDNSSKEMIDIETGEVVDGL